MWLVLREITHMMSQVNWLLNSILDINYNNSDDNRQSKEYFKTAKSVFQSTSRMPDINLNSAPPPPRSILYQEQENKIDTRKERSSHPSPCLLLTVSSSPWLCSVTKIKHQRLWIEFRARQLFYPMLNLASHADLTGSVTRSCPTNVCWNEWLNLFPIIRKC